MIPIFVGIASAIIMGLFMYIDSRLFDLKKDKLTYIKNMLLTGLISGLCVYFTNGGLTTLSQTTNSAQLGGSAIVSGINQEILTGIPTF
jgi:hypothetical protein